jgi:hypothetical protein
MMTGFDSMMGSMLAWMLGLSVLTWLLALVILALVAVWLFQHVRHGGTR